MCGINTVSNGLFEGALVNTCSIRHLMCCITSITIKT